MSIFSILTNGEIKPHFSIFESIQQAFENKYRIFYTLIAIITEILNSNFIYLKYDCVTLSSNFYQELSYKEAVSKYSEYKGAKGSNTKVDT